MQYRSKPGQAYSFFAHWAATDRRNDVVGLYYNFDLSPLITFQGSTKVRYSAYGVPEPVLKGDVNLDGTLDATDIADTLTLIASGDLTLGVDATYSPDADLNLDGKVDQADVDLVTQEVNDANTIKTATRGYLFGLDWSIGVLRAPAIGFGGAYYDQLTGLSLMRNRWYDAELGRFVSREPAGYVDGMSLYQYVMGNPLKYWDPGGWPRCLGRRSRAGCHYSTHRAVRRSSAGGTQPIKSFCATQPAACEALVRKRRLVAPVVGMMDSAGPPAHPPSI